MTDIDMWQISHEGMRVKHELQQERKRNDGGLRGDELVQRCGMSTAATAAALAEIMEILPRVVTADRVLGQASLFDLPESLVLSDYIYKWAGIGGVPDKSFNGLYLSGPITSIGLPEAKRRFNAVARWIAQEWWVEGTIINPLGVEAACGRPGACAAEATAGSDRKFLTETGGSHRWQCNLRYDLKALLSDGVDAIVVLPYKKSRGVTLELHVASVLGYHAHFISEDTLSAALTAYSSDGLVGLS
jgi:hypothetical protein